MGAIVVTDRAAGRAGIRLVDRPDPGAARLASLDVANYGDVVVEACNLAPLPGDVDFVTGAGVAFGSTEPARGKMVIRTRCLRSRCSRRRRRGRQCGEPLRCAGRWCPALRG